MRSQLHFEAYSCGCQQIEVRGKPMCSLDAKFLFLQAFCICMNKTTNDEQVVEL